jgi:hypothetical protein
MPSVPLALVALGKRFAELVLPGAFASVRGCFSPDARGVILLGTTSAADSQHVAAWVREIHLEKWHATVLVREAESSSRGHGLACWAPYHGQRR